ncbi:phytoene/squalene synthase family protein [Saliniramus sp.]|uniref:phytoene/squalene synthase family protein n=1 Tax=Saliniramus sp. TaxID=2986772 RepID=UPI002B90B40F|nr:squalene/phytoene synthase family protein [Saliniramus sp.]
MARNPLRNRAQRSRSQVDEGSSKAGFDAFAHCESLVRAGDPDRYFASLFADATARPHLFALYAFTLEIARVRDAVSQALAGEIRLQWWRDALAPEAATGALSGDVRANPVAAALLDTIARFNLPVQPLLDLIDARLNDLYDDPFADLNQLEGYCGETFSAPLRLAGLILTDGADAGDADAAGHAGVALGMTALMRAFPLHARRGQLMLPPLDVLGEQGLTRGDVVAGRADSQKLAAAMARMREQIRRHRDAARAALPACDPRIGPLYLPLALIPLYLDRMQRADYAPYTSLVEVPRWRRLWHLWRQARKGWR